MAEFPDGYVYARFVTVKEVAEIFEGAIPNDEPEYLFDREIFPTIEELRKACPTLSYSQKRLLPRQSHQQRGSLSWRRSTEELAEIG